MLVSCPRRALLAVVFALGLLAPIAAVTADTSFAQPSSTEDATQKAADLQRAKSEGGVSPDRVIVVYKAGAAVQANVRATVRQRAGAQLLRSDGQGSREIVRAPARNARAVAAQLKQAPEVLDAYPDHVVTTKLTVDDPQLVQQWDLTKIGAPTAWDTSEGQGVKVAVLDCGIDTNHPDLVGQVVQEQNFTSDPTTNDLCNHGTHVAGTIAALTNNALGVASMAPAAHLLNGKVLDQTGSGWMSDIDTGIQWAADNGAQVINLSLGASIPCDSGTQQAVDYAWGKGVVVVAAAGNAGASGAESPGNCQNVISVAATDINDGIATWSNYGPTVPLAAPGVNILSTVNPDLNGGSLYEQFSGTSMAAPHVAGLAALLWSSSYGTSAASVRDRLFATADNIAGTGTESTFGRIDAAAALRAAAQAPVSPMIPPTTPSTLAELSLPQRIADTRVSGGAIQAGTTRCFAVGGQSGIPLDALGVVLNVTAVGYTAPGWVTVYPAGQPVPSTSTLNFDPSVYAAANGTFVRIGSSGQVCASVGTINSTPGGAQLVLDATGYIPSVGASVLSLLGQPERIVDTRSSGGAIASGSTRCFTVAGQDGIPTDAAAVILNVTAVGYGTQGWLTVYPAGQTPPATSTLDFDPSVYATADGSTVGVGSGGQVCVGLGTVNASAGSAQVVLDVVGYLAGTASAALPMLPAPQRVVDTRSAGGPIAAGATRCFAIAGQAGIPSNATAALVTVTAVGYTTNGWLSAYAAGQNTPTTSTLNFDRAEYAVANSATLPLGTNGQVCVNVGTPGNVGGSTHVVLDVTGYVAP